MNAGTRFEFMYDHRALSWVHAALLLFLLFRVTQALLDLKERPPDRRAFLDMLVLTAVGALPRILLWKRNIIRPAHFLQNMDVIDKADQVSFRYPISFTALVRLLKLQLGDSWDATAIAFGCILALSILTPIVVYLLSRELFDDRRLAVVAALLVAVNPAAIIMSGHYDFFPASVFYETLSHFFLVRLIKTSKVESFVGFLLSSYVFYTCRPENYLVFYLHLGALVWAFWSGRASRVLLGLGGAVYVFVNLAYQYDWVMHKEYEVHVVSGLPLAPLTLLRVLFRPDWNHFLDLRYSPPYLVALMIIGFIQVVRERSPLYVYPVAMFGAFLLVYCDLPSDIPVGNMRYFMNLVPAMLLVVMAGLRPLFAKWPRAYPATLAIALLSLPFYAQAMRNTEWLPQREYSFYRERILPLLKRDEAVWHYQPNTEKFMEYAKGSELEKVLPADGFIHYSENLPNEFDDSHLFETDHIPTVTRDAEIYPGTLIYLGLSCYQLSVEPGKLLPECEKHLADPRNEVVVATDLPIEVFHKRAPWIHSKAVEAFDKVHVALLRRTRL